MPPRSKSSLNLNFNLSLNTSHNSHLLKLAASRAIWRGLEGLSTAWRGIDVLVSEPGLQDRVLDRTIGRIRGRSLFAPFSFWEQGWGDTEVPNKFSTWLNACTQEARELYTREAHELCVTAETVAHQGHKTRPIEVKLSSPTTYLGVCMRELAFQCPAHEILHLLPQESHLCRGLVVSPLGQTEPREWGPILVSLPGTGDHGFRRRLVNVGLPLALTSGITTVIPESPFYGVRKPPGQFGSRLRRVSDLPVLGRATIEEALAILNWVRNSRSRQNDDDLVVTGVSMGGLHAAMTASLAPFSLGVVAWTAPTSASLVFSRGLLSEFCAWASLKAQMGRLAVELQGDAPDTQVAATSVDDVRSAMRRFLAITDIANFPAPCDPSRARFVVARDDLYVPPEETMESWTRIVQDKWRGAKVNLVPGGHVSCTLFGGSAYRDLIREVFHAQ